MKYVVIFAAKISRNLYLMNYRPTHY